MMVARIEISTHEIWSGFKTNLQRFIARRVRNEADAEDVLQEVFCKIHRHIDGLEDGSKLHPWVYRITRNAITDYYRARRPGVSLDTSPDAPPDPVQEEAPAAEEAREEILSCLRPMIDKLPDRYRQALLLADVEGLPQAGVAERLDLSLSGAKSRVQRAREKVKIMLLDCCRFELDRLGRVVDYEERERGCASCGPVDNLRQMGP